VEQVEEEMLEQEEVLEVIELLTVNLEMKNYFYKMVQHTLSQLVVVELVELLLLLEDPMVKIQ
jgi:hypothetical protein